MAKHSGYMDRAMKARDPRFRRVLAKLGYERRDLIAELSPIENIADLRDEYQRAFGKRPFHGWDAATLRAKIEAADES